MDQNPEHRPAATDLDSAIQAVAAKHVNHETHTVRKQNTQLRRLVALLLVALASVVGWILVGRGPAATPVDPATEAWMSRAFLYTVIQSVDAFESENGRLPRDLAEVGMDLPEGGPLHYEVDGARYTLTFDVADGVVRYRSGDDLTPFREAAGAPEPGAPDGGA